MEYDDTRFAILGPLRVWVGDRELAVSAGRERTLLAMLVVQANDLVPTEQLVDAIWGDQPPRDARNQVQGCVSRLRRRLASAGAGEVIRTGPEGYQVRVSAGGADVLEFRRLMGEAQAAAASGRPEEARDRYRAGLRLWRGPVLAGIDSDVVRQAATRLEEERVQAWQECFEVELALGAGGELVPELTDLVRHHPYRESLHSRRQHRRVPGLTGSSRAWWPPSSRRPPRSKAAPSGPFSGTATRSGCTSTPAAIG